MKPFPILIALATLAVAMGVVSWMSLPTPVPPPVVNPDRTSENPFELSVDGPQPRATAAEEEFDFGMMILGEEREHTFVIKNEGDAPLKLHYGDVACKCTVPEVPEEPIPPGESAEVVMTWKPLASTSAFDKWAYIWTNDPEHEKVMLTITGEVRNLVDIRPGSPWTINQIKEEGETTFEGGIASGKDEFQILGIDSSVDWLSADVTPMSQEYLQEFGEGYVSGYIIEGKLRAGMEVGRFSEKLTIRTDLRDGHTMDIVVAGTRQGPFSIIGQDWIGSEMTVRMGDVPVSEGKSVSLSLFTTREDEPLTFASVTAKPDIVSVDIKRDESFTAPTKEKYDVTFTLAPDAPQGRYKDDKRISMKIMTNREAFPEINLALDAVVK